VSIDLPRSRKPRVSIIIPAGCPSPLLHACLRSLERFGPRDIPYETSVVMNHATADDAAQLRTEVTGVEVVASTVNLGLAGAGNRGRSLARGEYLVLLHDDAEVEPGWLEALVETADAHPEAGAVGGTVLYPDGGLQDAGLILWRDASTSPPWVGQAPASAAFARLRAVDYCGTSSLLVRTAAWDAAGGLDERFYPVYYVDVDLAMALRRRGWLVLFQPASRIRHHRGASGSPAFRSFVSQRNRRMFRAKWRAALEEHEPPRMNSVAAVERAWARAEAFAESRRRRPVMQTDPPAQPAPFDSISQELRSLEKDRELRDAYAARVFHPSQWWFARRIWDTLRRGIRSGRVRVSANLPEE
jgi:GT2 family glycosyltransferase